MKKHFLHSNLKHMRKLLLLSQNDLSDKLEMGGVIVSRASIEAYENGRNEPNIKVLKALADFFNVSMDDLCFKEFKN